MTQLLIEIWGVIVAFWNIGLGSTRYGLNVVRWVFRMVLLAILVWPIVVLAVAYYGRIDVTAIVAMAPVAVFFILILVYPLVSGVFAAVPQVRVVWRYLLLVVFVEVTVGLYLTFVPVWNNPRLIGVLVLVGATLGMFLVLRLMFGWQNRWARGFLAVLTLGIVAITILFFFGGRERFTPSREIGIQQESAQPGGSVVGRVEEFTVNAGEEIFTVLVGPGTIHRVSADKRCLAVSTQLDGKTVEYEILAGSSSIQGTAPEGLLRVKGVEDGATLRFERVR